MFIIVHDWYIHRLFADTFSVAWVRVSFNLMGRKQKWCNCFYMYEGTFLAFPDRLKTIQYFSKVFLFNDTKMQARYIPSPLIIMNKAQTQT